MKDSSFGYHSAPSGNQGSGLAQWSINSLFESALIPLTTAAALIFVLVGAGHSLWLDEVQAVSVASEPFHRVVEQLRHDVNPPAYYLMLGWWTRLFGDSEAACRSLSGLLYFLTGGTVFLAASYWFSDKRVGFYSSFLFLVSTQALQNAQIVRSYALLGLVAAASIYFFLRLIGSFSPTPYDCVGLVVANMLGSFTHFWFFFVYAAELITTIIFVSRRLRTFLTLAFVSSLPFAALWFPIFLEQLRNGATASLNSFMPPFDWIFVPDTMLVFYGGLVRGLLFYTVLILLLLCGHPIWSVARHDRRLWVLTTLFATILLLPMVVCVFKPIYWRGRYTIIGLPALSILLGSLVARFANRTLLLITSYAWVLWTATVFVQSTFTSPVEGPPVISSDRDTADYLVKHAQKGDVLVFTSLSRLAVDYYLKRNCGNCFREVSFPAEIDQHRVWRDVPAMLKRQPSLEAEAERNVREWSLLANQTGASIWLLYGRDRDISDILKMRLDTQFSLKGEIRAEAPFHLVLLKYNKRSDPRI